MITADMRIMYCGQCGGDGGFDDTYIDRSHSVVSDWHECRHCNGKGFLEIEVEPITMFDLEMWHGATQ